MIKINEGRLIASGMKIAIVCARFNSFITERLIEGAIDTLKRHGCEEENIEIFKVPGCFEVPLAASRVVACKKFDGVVCLGALIRGETPHFDYIASESIKGIAQTALQTGCVLTYGIITADTVDQAINRASLKSGNKGSEAALAAIEMIDLLRQCPIA